MKSKVLYYPYVRVPDSLWLTRLLLYWDSIGTIVPYEFLENPEKLGEHTRSLVQHELIKQVIPGMYLWAVPKFEQGFLGYVDTLGDELRNRRARMKQKKTHRIHAEKLEQLADQLVDRRLQD